MTIDQINKESAEIIEKEFPIKKRTPRNYDSILNGALALELHERVELKKRIAQSITDEVDAAKKRAEEAAKIAEE